MKLYPKILYASAADHVKNALRHSPQSLRDSALRGDLPLVDQSARYSATGGARVTEAELWALRQEVWALADSYGFPNQSSVRQRSEFDASCSGLLHVQMEISPSSAADHGLWMHMTCVLLPDVVRWRFSGDTTNVERFIGSDRGKRRNAFGRLWWRAHLLSEGSDADDRYHLLRQFGEDDLVQITERPSIAASPRLARMLLDSIAEASVLQVKNGGDEPPSRALIRDVVKRVRRRLASFDFDLMDDQELSETIADLVMASRRSLSKQGMRTTL